MKPLSELTEREVVALAIANEEENTRIYQSFADRLRRRFPGLRRPLRRDGAGRGRAPPPADRDASGEVRRAHPARPPRRRARLHPPPAVWWSAALDLDRIAAGRADGAAGRDFYEKGGEPDERCRSPPAPRRPRRSGGVAATTAHRLGEELVPASVRAQEDEAERRLFVLRIRPARACRPHRRLGLDPGAALRRRLCHAAVSTTFLVGLAASLGAGICMGFAEALSDDGSLTGRRRPVVRGIVCGLMTTLGGLGHTLPYPRSRQASARDRRRGPGGRSSSSCDHRVDPHALHGHAVLACGVAGRCSAACWCSSPAS